MFTKTKATAIVLDSDETAAIGDAFESAATDGDGNPVLEVYDEDDNLLGSVVWHAGTEASELTE